MKRERNLSAKRKKILIAIVFVAFILTGIKMYFDTVVTPYNPNCTIEYGEGECIDGYFRVPFYNPNQQHITKIRITVPMGAKTNITLPADFNVNEPLEPATTGVLSLFPCKEDVDLRSFSAEWCCGIDCYKTVMLWPKNEIKISKEG